MSTPASSRSTVQATKARSPEPRSGLNQVRAVVGAAHAFEGVVFLLLSPLFAAPTGRKGCSSASQPGRVQLTGLQKMMTFVPSTVWQSELVRGRRTLRCAVDEQFVVESLCRCKRSWWVLFFDGLAGS